jgi:hypothetical protein
MTRFNRIKQEFSGFSGSIKLFVDGTNFFFVDVDDDRIEGYKFVTASCGCCSDTVDYENDLSHEIEYMDDMDFSDLLDELRKLK